MIGGQNADIEAEEQTTPMTTEQILFIHANKTAALIQSAMTIGATLAGATDEEIAALELCAYNVGHRISDPGRYSGCDQYQSGTGQACTQ